MISIKNIKYSYKKVDDKGNITDDTQALNGIDLEISDGEFIAILGANGSGKSTLGMHLNGLIIPDEGDVIVDGMNTKDESVLLDIRKKVGMVFQNPDNQIIASIVEEDVAFGPENIGMPPDTIRESIDESLELVSMSKYKNKNPNYLSGGQKQRVAIAGILAIRPKAIVLDEATAMLDPKGRKDVVDLITKLNKEKGVSIILITHYMEEITKADRVVIMSNGKIAMQGTPKEIFSKSDELEKLGLDTPKTLKLSNKLKEKGLVEVFNIIERDELISVLCSLK